MKKRLSLLAFIFLIVGITSGYSREIPSLSVSHETKGKDVFVECIVSGISFRNSEPTNQKVGKMVVWVDGQKKSVVSSAVFIIRGLSPGNHNIKLVMVNLNNMPYGLAKEFMVNIPN